MSDPVTNVEIEDVLSSIRRLVSSGNKADDAREPAKNTQPPHPEKFVLTPALRVTDDEQLVESPASAPSGDDWMSGNSEASFEEEPTLVLNMSDASTEQSLSHRDSLEATIAELEAAVTAQPDEWEPDGSEIHSVPTWETVSYPTLDDVEDAVAVDVEDTIAVEEEAQFVKQDATVDYIFREVEEEPAIDDFSRIGLSFEPLHSVGEVEKVDEDEDYGDDLAPDPPVSGTDEDIDAYLFANEGGVDEEMLRQMVMEIVRSELQGKMGERITRNVRKMVRREIHRVLTSQDFD